MQATLILQITLEDLRQAIAQEAPAEHEIVFHVTIDRRQQLLALVWLPANPEYQDALDWIPYSWTARQGDRLVLGLDHDTLVEIATARAVQVTRRLLHGSLPAPQVRFDPSGLFLEFRFDTAGTAATPTAAAAYA